MRTYGRQTLKDGTYGPWVQVATDANGFDSYVWVTTLIQCLKLALGESPFFANYGIPAQQSIITQIFPDYYLAQMQSQFSQYFASLSISRNAPVAGEPDPTYTINIVTKEGTVINQKVAQ